MTWRVRQATEADVAAVRAVATEAWRDTYPGLLGPETIESFVDWAYSEERVRRRITRHLVLLAEGDAGVAAFVEAMEDSDHLVIVSFYARPMDRGKRSGTALLEALLDRYPAMPIAADVVVGNGKGETFYEARGFVPREELAEELFGEVVRERRWWREP